MNAGSSNGCAPVSERGQRAADQRRDDEQPGLLERAAADDDFRAE